jgi:hypothetical protein
LVGRNPGVSARSASSMTCCTPVFHKNSGDLQQAAWSLQLEHFPEGQSKHFQMISMLFSRCHWDHIQCNRLWKVNLFVDQWKRLS